ncbi:DNA-directed DNA polymerase [Senna tora]|uniref:DNA-directed DNA polymerase n=1 Tax=Senna tora TaxID=362788 RepID=A0A834TF17_9FABA|nr:DNA-directed DNA polymerase [Senna tora]
MAAERTLRELNAPPVDQQPLCITAQTLATPFKLKSGLIHLLPKFRGLPNENPYKHLKEFHIVFSSMRPQDVTTEQVKLRAFQFSLDDAAKDWLFYLPPDVVKSLASSMQSLEQQMSQIAASVSILESQGKLPSQTETNPKHNANTITLRSGKELEDIPAKLRRGHALETEAGTEPEAELETTTPWYTDLVNYISSGLFPDEASSAHEKEKIETETEFRNCGDTHFKESGVGRNKTSAP